MNVTITSISSVEEVAEFLEGKGLREITDKIAGNRPFSSSVTFISDLSFSIPRNNLKLTQFRKST